MIEVPRETRERLERLVDLVIAENKQQNLIAPSTLDNVWKRHIEDSLQLLPLAPATGTWLDVGTGAGFPGLVIAASQPERPVFLVEPRRRRADFLERAARELGCANVQVHAAKVEGVRMAAVSVISARAVAALPMLFAATQHLAGEETVWLLPRGRCANEELAEARRSWQGVFHVERSATDADSGIVVARQVTRKGVR